MTEETMYTLSEVASFTGMHKNSIRNYVKRGYLKAELIDRPRGGQIWVISEHNLYHCGMPKILQRLGPQAVATRIEAQEAASYAVPERYLEEITRLARENQELYRQISELSSEKEILKYQVQKALPAAEEEAKRWENEASLWRQATEEARANAKWSWRRRMNKVVAE